MDEIPSNLLPRVLHRVERDITSWFLVTPAGTTLVHVLDPAFWVHWVEKLKLYDEITVVAADGRFDCLLRVIALDPRGLWAQTRVLRMFEGAPAEAIAGRYPDKDGYTVEFDPVMRWRIVRGRELVARDFPDEGEAVAALANLKATTPRRRVA